VGRVRLFKCTDLVVGEVQVQCCDRVRQVMGLGRSDDGCGDDGVLQHPGQGDLRHAGAPGFGDALDRVDDGLVER
jgi:hypothetical protein